MDSIEEIFSVISLICPLGQKKIKIPVKGDVCKHKQPFDKDTFLEVLSIKICYSLKNS